ncbi:POZ domain-containing protein KCTD16 [Seminavis robusta]|uniref:POZ domain-containing protein KCTD16 n=1 Tax=Seminavis robusta TaxID=568900 RepID=A0A9N8HEG2_9STRA|nr:POZ domain-containing protein KCTD16 [Seminavis robusta]|eukprot:Sro471_g149740.1 POZ domain-containing protein KCTD16 (120) ;mRNA; r:36390-36749
MTSNTAIVRLNVGGSKYEVPKSLIEMYPNTMLARLISEQWEGGNEQDPNKEIFIDRDGQRFQCVLDYMRDQKAYLPHNMAKASVMHDLKYLGFVDVPDDAIEETLTTPEAVKHIRIGRK